MGEREWKPIPGYPIYEASDDGQIRSISRVRRTGRHMVPRQFPSVVLSPTITYDGYEQVALSAPDGKRRSHTVHRLVLMAFAGPCPDGMEGCHNDGNRRNNHVSNLRWDTRLANVADRQRHNPPRAYCGAGHEFTPENTYHFPNGGTRQCRECRRAWRVARKEQEKANA